MPPLHFIIQGSDAADTALVLKQYLQSNWKPEKIETKVSDTPSIISMDFHTKGFDPSASLEVLLQLYGAFKLVKDGVDLPDDIVNTKKKLEKLANWLEKKLTNNHDVIWLQINGIPYAIKIENLDNIMQALEKQE